MSELAGIDARRGWRMVLRRFAGQHLRELGRCRLRIGFDGLQGMVLQSTSMVLRRLAALLPQPFMRRLNEAQHHHERLAGILRPLGDRVAAGEGTIHRGPAAGLRIDASGRMPGYVLGTADYEEQRWLTTHLKCRDTFYDVGANIGFFTLLAAKLVGSEGHVVAFEPLAANVEQLRRNVALNGFANVTVVAAAISARESVGLFSLGRSGRDQGKLVETDSPGDSVRVPVTTIDAAVSSNLLRPPAVMKIDVEGEEINALRGARDTIIRHRPTLLVEVHWLARRFLDFVDETLIPLGYRAETLSGDRLPAEPARFHAVLTTSQRASHTGS